MTTTRYYHSSQTSAPSLTGEVGSLIDLLKTVLVGTAGVAYDGRAAAGWTLAYEDVPAKVAVFRNSLAEGGTGCYLRVEDNANVTEGSAGARAAYAQVFESMSDVNTGTSGTNKTIWIKSVVANADAKRWAIWADELTVHINFDPNQAAAYSGESDLNHSNLCSAGDFVTYNGQPGCYVAGSYTTDSSLWPTVIFTYSGRTDASIYANAFTGTRNAAGTVGATYLTGGLNYILSPGGQSGSTAFPAAANPICVPQYVGEGSSKTLFGKLRGLYYSVHNLVSTTARIPGAAIGDKQLTVSCHPNAWDTLDSVAMLLVDGTGPW